MINVSSLQLEEPHFIDLIDELTVKNKLTYDEIELEITERIVVDDNIDINETINALKSKGYRVLATTPHTDKLLSEVKVDEPFALLFGTEKEGLTEEAMSLADEHIRIPMYGFTESFNISVSAALCMYDLSERMRKEVGEWKLTEEERLNTLLEWASRSVRDGDKILDRLFSANQ